MGALVLRTINVLFIGLALASATGCRQAPEPRPVPEPPESLGTTAPAAEETGATETAASDEAAVTSEQSDSSPSLGDSEADAPVKLGPTDAYVSWAYLKDMYEAGGVWYVVVDYIQVVGPEESLSFLNENPRLRTFPLQDGAKLLLLEGSGGPEYKSVSVDEFRTFEGRPGDEIVEVTPEGGYAKQLKEWWSP